MFTGLALLSSLMWGSSDFLGGKLAKRFPSLAVTGVSQSIGLATGITMLTISSGWLRPDFTMSGYLFNGVFAGLAGFVGLVSYYAGLSTGKMGVIAPITSLSAVIPLIYGLIQGEKPSPFQIAGMIVALLGCFLASGPEIKSGVSPKPILLGVLTSIMFGIALIFMARGSKVSALMTMTSMRFLTVGICIVIALFARSIGGFTVGTIPMLFVIGVADFLANFTLGVATTKGLLSVAMVLGSLFPVVTVLLAYRFLHERLQRVQYFGVISAVLGVALISAG